MTITWNSALHHYFITFHRYLHCVILGECQLWFVIMRLWKRSEFMVILPVVIAHIKWPLIFPYFSCQWLFKRNMLCNFTYRKTMPERAHALKHSSHARFQLSTTFHWDYSDLKEPAGAKGGCVICTKLLSACRCHDIGVSVRIGNVWRLLSWWSCGSPLPRSFWLARRLLSLAALRTIAPNGESRMVAWGKPRALL